MVGVPPSLIDAQMQQALALRADAQAEKEAAELIRQRAAALAGSTLRGNAGATPISHTVEPAASQSTASPVQAAGAPVRASAEDVGAVQTASEPEPPEDLRVVWEAQLVGKGFTSHRQEESDRVSTTLPRAPAASQVQAPAPPLGVPQSLPPQQSLGAGTPAGLGLKDLMCLPAGMGHGLEVYSDYDRVLPKAPSRSATAHKGGTCTLAAQMPGGFEVAVFAVFAAAMRFHSPAALPMCAAGHMLASGGMDRCVQLWDLHR